MKNIEKFIEKTIDELDEWVDENVYDDYLAVVESEGMFTRVINDLEKNKYMFICPKCSCIHKVPHEDLYFCDNCMTSFGGRQSKFENFTVFKHFKDSTFIAIRVDAKIRMDNNNNLSLDDMNITDTFAFSLDEYSINFYDLNKDKKISLNDTRAAKKYVNIISENNLGFIMNYYEIPQNILVDFNEILKINKSKKNLINPIYKIGELHWKESLRQVVSIMTDKDYTMTIFKSLQNEDPLADYRCYIKKDVESFRGFIDRVDLYKTDTKIGNKISGQLYCSKCEKISDFEYIYKESVGNGSAILTKSCCNEELITSSHFQHFSNTRDRFVVSLAEYYVVNNKLTKFVYEYDRTWDNDVVDTFELKKVITFDQNDKTYATRNLILDKLCESTWTDIIDTKTLFDALYELDLGLSEDNIYDAIESLRTSFNTDIYTDTSPEELRKFNGSGYVAISNSINKALHVLLNNRNLLKSISYDNLKRLIECKFIYKMNIKGSDIKELTGFNEEIFDIIITDDLLTNILETLFILNTHNELSKEEVLELQTKREFLAEIDDVSGMFNSNLEAIIDMFCKFEETNSFRLIKRIIEYTEKEYLDAHAASYHYREYLRGINQLINNGNQDEFSLYPKNIESMSTKIYQLKSFKQQDIYRFSDVNEKISILAKKNDLELLEIKTFEDLLKIEKEFKHPISFFKNTDTSIMMLNNKGCKKALLAVNLKQRVLSFSKFLESNLKNDRQKGVLEFIVRNGELTMLEKDFINEFCQEYQIEQNCIL